MSEEDITAQRGRFYSSMNYDEYVSVFDKPPQKPCIRPQQKKVIDAELSDFHLEGDTTATDSSNELPEIRKPSQSVNFTIGKNLKNLSLDTPSHADHIVQKQREQIEETTADEEEDLVDANLQSNPVKQMAIENRSRSQSDTNHKSILEFLGSRSRKQSLAS